MEVHQLFKKKAKSGRENIEFLPESLRMIIVGTSGAGKSTLLFNLILNEGWLSYDHLIIYAKTLFQDEYKLLRECLERGFNKNEIRECFKNGEIVYEGTREPLIKSEFHSSDEKIQNPESLPPGRKLLIFDDISFEQQTIVKKFFCQGRHSDVSVVLLSQNYFLIDRRAVRTNANILVVFKQSYKNIIHLHSDFAAELTLIEFSEFCKKVWKEARDFIVIDTTSNLDDGRFRHNFTRFYYPRILFE